MSQKTIENTLKSYLSSDKNKIESFLQDDLTDSQKETFASLPFFEKFIIIDTLLLIAKILKKGSVVANLNEEEATNNVNPTEMQQTEVQSLRRILDRIDFFAKNVSTLARGSILLYNAYVLNTNRNNLTISPTMAQILAFSNLYMGSNIIIDQLINRISETVNTLRRLDSNLQILNEEGKLPTKEQVQEDVDDKKTVPEPEPEPEAEQ
jgi:hypothetical protein